MRRPLIHNDDYLARGLAMSAFIFVILVLFGFGRPAGARALGDGAFREPTHVVFVAPAWEFRRAVDAA